jgi:hypothetical protein
MQVQQLGVDIDCDQFWSVLIAAVAVMCTLAIALPNCTTLPLLEAGLVQIANVLTEQSWDPKRPDSDCQPSHGQAGSNRITNGMVRRLYQASSIV